MTIIDLWRWCELICVETEYICVVPWEPIRWLQQTTLLMIMLSPSSYLQLGRNSFYFLILHVQKSRQFVGCENKIEIGVSRVFQIK